MERVYMVIAIICGAITIFSLSYILGWEVCKKKMRAEIEIETVKEVSNIIKNLKMEVRKQKSLNLYLKNHIQILLKRKSSY
jgi:hypothetical protein